MTRRLLLLAAFLALALACDKVRPPPEMAPGPPGPPGGHEPQPTISVCFRNPISSEIHCISI
jgi:hypothetical protein